MNNESDPAAGEFDQTIGSFGNFLLVMGCIRSENNHRDYDA
jgi:hypothetical protein